MAKVIELGHGPNPWRVAGWSLAALLLPLPLVAMQFTREVNWTMFDFAFAAVMIGTVGIAFGGMAWARFRARGASRAMTMAAIANAAVGLVAVVAGRNDPPGIVGLIVLNGFFVLLFLGAARLFGIAAEKQ